MVLESYLNGQKDYTTLKSQHIRLAVSWPFMVHMNQAHYKYAAN
jgi:hypothetical protein